MTGVTGVTAADARLSRHDERRRALEILYEADLKERPIARVLATHLDGESPPTEFTLQLVRGVNAHQEELDALISANAKDWKLARMPVVDRNLLRIGLFEILHVAEVPTAVAIDEAVELAKELSTDSSGRFVNGLLARLAPAAEPPAVASGPDG